MLNNAEAEAIGERADGAMAGPWELHHFNPTQEGEYTRTVTQEAGRVIITEGVWDDATEYFIAASRTDVPALLADRAERTALLRTLLLFAISHTDGCASVWESTNDIPAPCDCGLDELLAEIREAVC